MQHMANNLRAVGRMHHVPRSSHVHTNNTPPHPPGASTLWLLFFLCVHASSPAQQLSTTPLAKPQLLMKARLRTHVSLSLNRLLQARCPHRHFLLLSVCGVWRAQGFSSFGCHRRARPLSRDRPTQNSGIEQFGKSSCLCCTPTHTFEAY